MYPFLMQERGGEDVRAVSYTHLKTKIKKIAGRSMRCVFLKMNSSEEKQSDMVFQPVSEYEQEELPFD